MARTFLELIEAERERVQALRTHFVIASALQAELDERVSGQELIYDNTTLHSMAVEHRLGLVQRLAGWVRQLCGAHGLLDQIIASHLDELCRKEPDDDEVPAIDTETTRELFARRFPHGAPAGAVTAVDIEAIRSGLLEEAAPILESCDAFRRWLESANDEPFRPVSLDAAGSLIRAAEELVGELRLVYDGTSYGFSDHLAHPSPRVVARDLVDLTLLGSIEYMLSVTGVNERLGASGAWWWQHRDGFWKALAKAAQ